MNRNFDQNNLKHSKKRLYTIIFSSILICIFLFITVFSFFKLTKKADVETYAQGVSVSSDLSGVSTLQGKEMRGVWIATVSNVNFPSKTGLSASQLKSEIDDIIKTAKSANLNSIFFQARPSSDALYKSEIFPYSSVISGKQGKSPDKDFDPLEYIVKEAHKNGLELHAWVNPYRITLGSSASPAHDLSVLADSNPAKIHPEYIVKYADGKMYYDPGLPEVRELIFSGVAEIVKNYDVDGIHIDDYFYPYPVSGAVFDDAETFAKYGGGMSIDDWRRDNVNKTVKGIYDTVKSIRSDCSFGVSPFGIYANSSSETPVLGSETKGLEAYSSLYCDALAWANGGYVDYLAPQDYWAFTTSAAPFDTVARWWNANLDGTGVDLYIGHALYKISEFPENEIPIQVEFSRNLLCYKGSIFYGYADLKKNSLGVSDKLSSLYEKEIRYENPASTGEVSSINYPSNGFKTSANTQYMLGSSDPAYPVTLNGNALSRTKNGFFNFYTTLTNGQNSYALMQNGNSISHSVTYVTQSSSKNTYLSSFDITETSPDCETWISKGDTIELSCTAPAGCTVKAAIGGASVSLSPTLKAKNTSSNYAREVYTGKITFSDFAKDGEIATLGTLKFTATLGNKSVTKSVALVKQIGKGAYIYAQVNSDYTYLKKSPTSSFYNDYTPTSPGMRDYITAFENGYYRLKFGGYVSSEKVTVVEGQPLYDNRILSAQMQVYNDNTQNYENNTTDMRFAMLDNSPVNVTFDNNKVNIEIFSTDPAFLPKMSFVRNPLFSSVSVSKKSDSSVVYTATLKDINNYYGFNLSYDSSFLIIKFNNPVTLASGSQVLAGKTIYVDAGHGGADIGARGPGSAGLAMFESGLNLEIANHVINKLQSLGANVVATRTIDTTVDIYERLDMISDVVPDLLISIHHNSVGDSVNASKARGVLGLYSNNSGIMLADCVSSSVANNLNRYKRKTAYQMLAMARDHRFPSTLTEMSFISNAEEFQWTLSEGNFERSADAVVQGILDFYNKQQAYLNY